MSEHHFKIYKSYMFRDKDPVIDRLRTMVGDSGLSYARVSEESDVSVATLKHWFEGDTRRPQYATVAAVAAGLGYAISFTKGNTNVVAIHPKRSKRA